MYSRKSAGPRMEPWGTPASLVKTSLPEPLEAVYYWGKKKKGQISDLNSIRLSFVKKTSMPNPVKSLRYIKCYSSSTPRPVKSPSNSIRYNCENICSWQETTDEKHSKPTRQTSLSPPSIHFFSDFPQPRFQNVRLTVARVLSNIHTTENSCRALLCAT